MSAIVASIWDTCPNTKPFLITADYWSKYLRGSLDWDACAPYLQQYDCTGTLGFGAADAGGTQNFYEPGNIPKNGTGMLTNTGGVISTPYGYSFYYERMYGYGMSRETDDGWWRVNRSRHAIRTGMYFIYKTCGVGFTYLTTHTSSFILLCCLS
ncbi:hypothetical protein AFLA_001719 [Aspergillus flavus NRRL3357]|nr:hypothetical protein AFLA_001719 [Aspergillus flavus NRRL3357]